MCPDPLKRIRGNPKMFGKKICRLATRSERFGTSMDHFDAVYGIKSDSTVQDILNLVVETLEAMFDEHQPNMRRTEA